MEKQRSRQQLKTAATGAGSRPGEQPASRRHAGADAGAATAGCPARRARRHHSIARGGDRRLAAHRHRHADGCAAASRSRAARIDDSGARAISRDRRSRTRRRSCCCRRRAPASVLRRVRLGRRRRAPASRCRDRTRSGSRTGGGALGIGHPVTLTLRQRRGLDLPPHHRGRRQIPVHAQRPGAEQEAAARSRSIPTGWSRATARRRCSATTSCTRA